MSGGYVCLCGKVGVACGWRRLRQTERDADWADLRALPRGNLVYYHLKRLPLAESHTVQTMASSDAYPQQNRIEALIDPGHVSLQPLTPSPFHRRAMQRWRGSLEAPLCGAHDLRRREGEEGRPLGGWSMS